MVDDPVLNFVKRNGDSFSYAEERRLFYVGMTRARRKLVLAYVNRQYEKEREPSRFLEETGL